MASREKHASMLQKSHSCAVAHVRMVGSPRPLEASRCPFVSGSDFVSSLSSPYDAKRHCQRSSNETR
jgi:hypothetical protein